MRNRMLDCKIRMLKRRKDVADAIISSGYAAIASQFPGRKLRTLEQYENRLEECKACCPSGLCSECGCNYRVKLVLRAFTCGKGKFKND